MRLRTFGPACVTRRKQHLGAALSSGVPARHFTPFPDPRLHSATDSHLCGKRSHNPFQCLFCPRPPQIDRMINMLVTETPTKKTSLMLSLLSHTLPESTEDTQNPKVLLIRPTSTTAVFRTPPSYKLPTESASNTTRTPPSFNCLIELSDRRFSIPSHHLVAPKCLSLAETHCFLASVSCHMMEETFHRISAVTPVS